MTIIEKYLSRFEAYSNGSLDLESRMVFEKDLEQNQKMHNAWMEYCDLMTALSDKEAISLRILLNHVYSDHFGVSIRKISDTKWYRLSAAALIFIIIGFLFYILDYSIKPSENINQLAGTTMDSTINDESNPVYPDTLNEKAIKPYEEIDVSDNSQMVSLFDKEEYQISPMYAELLHNVYRSNWFKIISPEDSVLIANGENIVFSWKTNIKEPIYFDILDRYGNVIYKQTDTIASPWTYKPNLSSAIYMYRFATKEQPVWVGVFVIKNELPNTKK